MVVTVRLHATLRRQTPDGMLDRLSLELEPGATIASVLEAVEIPLDADSVLLVLDGRMTGPGQPLADGDEVHLMPAMSGG